MRNTRCARLGAAALVSALALAAAAQDAPPADATPDAAPDAPATAAAGPYLAARAAGRAADFAAAVPFYDEALAGAPGDPRLLEEALVSNLGLGRTEAAAALADRMVDAGLASQAAHLVRAVARAQGGDWAGVLADLDAGRGTGPLVDGLTRAWARLATGDRDAALAAFDALAEAGGTRPFALYHKALALAQAGNLAAAEAILSLSPAEGMQRTRRAVIARAEVLGALGRAPEGVQAIDEAFGRDLDPTLASLRAALLAGEPPFPTLPATPAEGLAEVYASIAGALSGDDPQAALLYARAALALHPGQAEAALIAAGGLEELGQPALAREAYALVPAADPAFVAAEMGRAATLRREGAGEAALEVLGRLAQLHPDLPDVQATHGDQLRQEGRHAEAEDAYGRAIALYGEGADGASGDASGPAAGPLWFVHYTRALSRQARGDWEGAEADLRRALQLEPRQPQVLNHLGYSLVDRGESLPEALALIEDAVALEPGNGAVVDSLGWAYFRLGRFPEAVAELERAATLLPTDPVINDHLGDALWAVGREREARFQWSRALSFGPEEEDAALIRRKLEGGLEAVAGLGPDPVAGAPAPLDVAGEGSGGGG